LFASTVGGILQISFIIYNGKARCYSLRNYYLRWFFGLNENNYHASCGVSIPGVNETLPTLQKKIETGSLALAQRDVSKRVTA